MTTRLCARTLTVAGLLSGAVMIAGCNSEVPEPPPAVAPAPVAAPAAPRPAPRPVVTKTVAMSTATPSLAEKASAVLNRGANIDVAVAGFQSPQQFMATAYAAKNVGIPFMLLKHSVVDNKMSLARAIEALSKNNVDGRLEAARAEAEARIELARKTGPQ